ncbi:MAG: hypothetical protein WBA46_14810 [Thermomicrobiales bacterium]
MEVVHKLAPRDRRRCSRCHRTKPIEEFTRNSGLRNPEGRRYECRSCHTRLYRQWRQASGVASAAKARRLQRAEDVDLARTLIRNLRTRRLSWQEIATLTGIGCETIRRIARNDARWLNRRTLDGITSGYLAYLDRSAS